jgi:hypothetical protein
VTAGIASALTVAVSGPGMSAPFVETLCIADVEKPNRIGIATEASRGVSGDMLRTFVIRMWATTSSREGPKTYGAVRVRKYRTGFR